MNAIFNRFTLKLTKAQAQACTHPGPCDLDVRFCSSQSVIARQLARLDPADVAAELREYGAWGDAELADHQANLQRILWIAAGNIAEGD